LRLEDLVDLIERRNPGARPLDLLADSVLVSGQLSELADELVGYFVDMSRTAGASWADVGLSLGVTKQAAQKRFVGASPRRRSSLFTRFAAEARQIVIKAQESARDSGSTEIGTEHVLLAMVEDEGGLGSRAIAASGVSVTEVAAQARKAISPGDSPRKGHIPFSADAKKSLELALREAIRLKHRHIGSEHILLAMLRDESSEGGKILTGSGVRRAQVEEHILADAAG
jgi:hypothetical protein